MRNGPGIAIGAARADGTNRTVIPGSLIIDTPGPGEEGGPLLDREGQPRPVGVLAIAKRDSAARTGHLHTRAGIAMTTLPPFKAFGVCHHRPTFCHRPATIRSIARSTEARRR